MIARYDMNEVPFNEWVKGHMDCKEIAICGHIDEKSIGFFDVITSLVSKTIDVSELTFSYKGDNHDEPLDIHEYIDWEVEEMDCYRPKVILVLLANKENTSRFVVTKDGVLSEDKKTLVFLKDPYVSLNIPEGIMHIGDYACQGEWASDHKLPTEHLVIPEGVVSIGKLAFSDLAITSVTFPSTLRSLGEMSFESTELESVEIPEGVEEIPPYCFLYTYPSHIQLPNSLRVIRERAFTLSGYNEELIIPEGVEELAWDSLDYINKVSLPSTLTKLADDFYYEDVVSNDDEKPYIRVHEDNPCFYSIEGKIYEHGHTIEYIPYRKDKYKGEYDHRSRVC